MQPNTPRHDTSDRSLLLDRVKGIGILLVVYAHVARGIANAQLPIAAEFHYGVDRLIYHFHMPLFFVVSGMLFSSSLARHGRTGLIVHRLRTVAYPYVIWSLLQGGIELAFAGATNGRASLAEVASLLIQPRAHFWFLYALFACSACAAIAYRRMTMAWAVAAMLLAATGFVLQRSPVDLYAAHAVVDWFAYFALGVLATFAWKARGPGGAGPQLGFPFFALALAAFLAADHYLLGSPSSGGPAGVARLLELLVAGSGVAMIFALAASPMLPFGRAVEYLGQRSLEIYLVHIIAGSGARIFLQKVLGITDTGLHHVFGLACGIALPLLLGECARRAGAMRWLFGPLPWPK